MSRKTFQSFLISAFLFVFSALPGFANSNVRIVRLSLADGNVKIDRGTGEFEKAIVNLPITQGMKLRTADDGRAEVEFEDGSTLRLAPGTSVEFPELSLRDSGAKLSSMRVTKGTAYVEFTARKKDELTLQFGQEEIALTQAAHLRLGVDEKGAALAVFKGDLEVSGPFGSVEVKKNQTADFDFSGDNHYTLAKHIQQQPDDDWDNDQDRYHQQYASKTSSSYSPYSYGTSDLAYYGNFFNAPGYGMMWQPYFVGMGWNPFLDGAWSFYPGFGFGWVSAYPWGWTPYHYGTWAFLPGYGWAWQPGGVWMPMYTQVAVRNAPAGFVAPRAPTSGAGTIRVGRQSGFTMAGVSGSKVVIRSNAAGLGVPRGQFSNMAKLSQKVEKSGTVTRTVSSMPSPGFEPISSRGGSAGARGSTRASEPRASQPHQMSLPSAGTSRSSGSPHK
jgi:hypothetical protein